MPTTPWYASRPIAHRGLHDHERPENSLAAIDAAIVHGHPVEIDVHRTHAGELVVIHDDTLVRMTGAPGSVLTLDPQLRARLRLAGTDERIPSLAEVLARVAGRVPIVVDLKSGRSPAVLADAVADQIAGYRGELAVQSYHPLALRRLDRARVRRPLGLLASDFRDADASGLERFVLANLLLAPLARPAYVAYELRCLPCGPASVARRLGLPLVAWTIDSDESRSRARRLADNYIFEGIRP